MTRLTRAYRFSASHRLDSRELTAEQNLDLYGKCNNPHGHGHDYVLRVTVRGEVDQDTGRVISPGKLDQCVRDHVTSLLDHKDLNKDLPGLEGVPTTENLVRDIERRLRAVWGQHLPAQLESVWIQETPRNIIELRSR